jgi:isochorismate hydrolase|tara:strand:- start:192 stop:1457 length:1266 start_codon:yes stop_codon:yes gene_type:complete
MDYILKSSTVLTDGHFKYLQSSRESYPNIYGKDLPEGVEYLRTISLDFSKDMIVWDNTYDNNAQAIEDVTNTAQIIRSEGNPDEQELENGLKDSGEPGGYDIRDIGGRIRMYQDEKGHYQYIDGRTKSRLMKNLGHKKIPVDIYKIKDYNMATVRKLGSYFNQSKYAAGIISKSDIEKCIKKDIKEGYFKLLDTTVEINYSANHGELVAYAKQYGGPTFKLPTYQKIASNILNNYHGVEDVRFQYDEVKALAKLEQMEIYKDDFKNNGIYYHVCSASTAAKSFITAAKKAYALEKALNDKNDTDVINFRELRVVFHSGKIYSSDFLSSAKKIIDDGRRNWTDMLLATSSAYFHNADPSSKVVLYGCLPFAAKAGYDLHRIIAFTKPHTDQKLSLVSKHKEPIYFSDLDLEASLNNNLDLAA